MAAIDTPSPFEVEIEVEINCLGREDEVDLSLWNCLADFLRQHAGVISNGLKDIAKVAITSVADGDSDFPNPMATLLVPTEFDLKHLWTATQSGVLNSAFDQLVRGLGFHDGIQSKFKEYTPVQIKLNFTHKDYRTGIKYFKENRDSYARSEVQPTQKKDPMPGAGVSVSSEGKGKIKSYAEAAAVNINDSQQNQNRNCQRLDYLPNIAVENQQQLLLQGITEGSKKNTQETDTGQLKSQQSSQDSSQKQANESSNGTETPAKRSAASPESSFQSEVMSPGGKSFPTHNTFQTGQDQGTHIITGPSQYNDPCSALERAALDSTSFSQDMQGQEEAVAPSSPTDDIPNQKHFTKETLLRKEFWVFVPSYLGKVASITLLGSPEFHDITFNMVLQYPEGTVWSSCKPVYVRSEIDITYKYQIHVKQGQGFVKTAVTFFTGHKTYEKIEEEKYRLFGSGSTERDVFIGPCIDSGQLRELLVTGYFILYEDLVNHTDEENMKSKLLEADDIKFDPAKLSRSEMDMISKWIEEFVTRPSTSKSAVFMMLLFLCRAWYKTDRAMRLHHQPAKVLLLSVKG